MQYWKRSVRQTSKANLDSWICNCNCSYPDQHHIHEYQHYTLGATSLEIYSKEMLKWCSISVAGKKGCSLPCSDLFAAELIRRHILQCWRLEQSLLTKRLKFSFSRFSIHFFHRNYVFMLITVSSLPPVNVLLSPVYPWFLPKSLFENVPIGQNDSINWFGSVWFHDSRWLGFIMTIYVLWVFYKCFSNFKAKTLLYFEASFNLS